MSYREGVFSRKELVVIIGISSVVALMLYISYVTVK
jgi:hypothetical protein